MSLFKDREPLDPASGRGIHPTKKKFYSDKGIVMRIVTHTLHI